MQPQTESQPRKVLPGALIALALAFSAAALLSACEDQGPAEEAGEAIDEGMDNLEDTFDNDGPAENMGESMDEAMEDAEEAMQDEDS